MSNEGISEEKFTRDSLPRALKILGDFTFMSPELRKSMEQLSPKQIRILADNMKAMKGVMAELADEMKQQAASLEK